MYRIRLHGRGGQGVKTAGQVLGTAFFLEGFEVQDAPRYGAERRGAPILSYVRAARSTIHERGVIAMPDLVAVADDTLVAVPAAAVLQGVSARTVLLIASDESAQAWRERLNLAGQALSLRATRDESALACAGAAARLVGAIRRDTLERAVRDELPESPPAVAIALAAFDAMAAHEGLVRESDCAPAAGSAAPDWIDMPADDAATAAPAIRAAANSELANTGAWRTMRPVIDYARCNRCSWVCSTLCPDGAILVAEDRTPRIDYDHCKGCLICVAVCPPHAIAAQPETQAAA